MAETDAKHWFAFIPFDISVNSLAVFVTHVKGGTKPDHCGGVKVGQWRACWGVVGLSG
jgi:hypothetical protein